MNKIPHRGLAALTGIALLTATAEEPGWWRRRGVVTQDQNAATNDFAAANSGQLKWIATTAREEFDLMLPDGAGPHVAGAVDALPSGHNRCVVNVGQVKSLAAVFYHRLISLQLASAFPWTATSGDDHDMAPANIGQVKQVFSFDLDRDDDLLPDWWEQQIVDSDPDDPLRTIADVLPGDDPDQDGRDNQTEQRQGTAPLQPETAATHGIPCLLVTTPMWPAGMP